MRLKNEEYLMLKNVRAVIAEHTGRGDLLTALDNLLERFEKKREERRRKDRVKG